MKRHTRGVILLVAMVAVVALAFAGMALVRAVATSAAIGGNVNARQQAIFAASVALERNVVALFEGGVIDTANDDASHNYFASRQTGEDRRGVPATLLSPADYPAGAGVADAGDGFAVRHVIERLCLLPGAASIENCTLSPPSVEAASGAPPAGEPVRQPAYRVTMRVEGPGGAATFVQAMLCAAHDNPRLTWQVLDE
jgi:type IV pilus assembly protein PilX